VWRPTGDAQDDQPTLVVRRTASGLAGDETADLASYVPRQVVTDQRGLLRRIAAPSGVPEQRPRSPQRARAEQPARRSLPPRGRIGVRMPAAHRGPLRWLVGGLSLVLLGVLGLLGAALTIPRATVAITPAVEERRLVLTYGPLTSMDVDWVAPTRTVHTVVRVEIEEATTGTKEVPDGVARGRIRVVNATLEAFSLVAGREIRGTNGVTYRTTETVFVPAADPFGSQAFGVADVPVEATLAGPEGNAEPGVVAGQLADGVLYRNIEPISGGSTRTVRYVTGDDLERARRAAIDALGAKTAAALASALRPGEVVIDSTVQAGSPTITFSHDVQAETDRLLVRGSLPVEAQAYEPATMHQLAQEEAARRLAQSTDQDVVILGNTLRFGEPEQIDAYRWRVEVSARVRLVPSERELEALRAQLTGERLDRAAAEVRRVAGVGEVAIELRPRWWPARLPDRAAQIEVVVRD